MMRNLTFWAYDDGRKFCMGIAQASDVPELGDEMKLEIGGKVVCRGHVTHVSQTLHGADVTLEAE